MTVGAANIKGTAANVWPMEFPERQHDVCQAIVRLTLSIRTAHLASVYHQQTMFR